MLRKLSSKKKKPYVPTLSTIYQNRFCVSSFSTKISDEKPAQLVYRVLDKLSTVVHKIHKVIRNSSKEIYQSSFFHSFYERLIRLRGKIGLGNLSVDELQFYHDCVLDEYLTIMELLCLQPPRPFVENRLKRYEEQVETLSYMELQQIKKIINETPSPESKYKELLLIERDRLHVENLNYYPKLQI